MKISKKQKAEIDFLSNRYNKFTTNEKEIEEFINCVVYGKIKLETDSTNRLFQAKRSLEIMIKMWKQDIKLGDISVAELKNDFNHPYFDKLAERLSK